MFISSFDLTIEEMNKTLGIITEVNYFTLPEEPFAALVRSVTIKNISNKKRELQILDGMPVIVPYGLSDRLLKDMCRTIEAWFEVVNLEKKAPFYNLKVVVSDKPQVCHIKEGNFYLSFHHEKDSSRLLEPIIDSELVFGAVTGFGYPQNFLLNNNFKVFPKQSDQSRTPCAMGYLRFGILPDEAKTIYSLIGPISSQEKLNRVVKEVLNKDYIQKKSERNKEIIQDIKNLIRTESSSREFDFYCQQTFLDNVMRGGLPISLETHEGKIIFYVFSRKHGDPERDYNKFILAPTYLSQGNGNYRDINQNRRMDVFFNPEVRDADIISFYNLIQADGFNPLIIKGSSFVIDDPENLNKLLNGYVEEKDKEAVASVLARAFVPGELLLLIEENDIDLKTSPEEFLKKVLTHCHREENAEHGEGFWTDHWMYNTDLLESYLAIYPERLREILIEKKEFYFYQNPAYVVPRDKKYILTEDGPRQYHAVAGKHEDLDLISEAIHSDIDRKATKLCSNYGKGNIYYTNLINKILCIIVNKVSSLDPFGVGIEMEANKPNWYDALNGLPGLFGSSICETFELKRLATFLKDAIINLGLKDSDSIEVFEELFEFIIKIRDLLKEDLDNFSFWDSSCSQKEAYRQRILKGISGKELELDFGQIREFLELVIKKVDNAIERSRNSSGQFFSYFINEIVEYVILNEEKGGTYIRPKRFRQRSLPIFLEAFVHALRAEKDKYCAKKIYRAVRESELFDKKLRMYKVSGYLSEESEEIGRTKVFPRGWLENESIWLHMEYKFLLEVLRAGLYEEFYEDFKNCLVCFQDPKVYGRSILENSSFIVSSVNSDKSLHGRGFVARLSGSTAELLHIWLLMNVGQRPFYLNSKGRLCLEFKPALAGWLFTKEGVFSFAFLGSISVVYHNPQRKDTFGRNGAKIKEIKLFYLDGKKFQISSNIIGPPFAQDIRDRKIAKIDVELG